MRIFDQPPMISVAGRLFIYFGFRSRAAQRNSPRLGSARETTGGEKQAAKADGRQMDDGDDDDEAEDAAVEPMRSAAGEKLSLDPPDSNKRPLPGRLAGCARFAARRDTDEIGFSGRQTRASERAAT